MDKYQPFLLEIGTEELPPKALKRLSDELKCQLKTQLANVNLLDNAAQITAFATPRRLAVYIDALATHQPDKVIDRKGPAINQAYDSSGQPTPAALGFARSVGLEVNQLQRQKTAKGEWLYCQINQPGKSAQEVVPGCVEQALKALPIPKRMRWGSLEVEFIRPVKWLMLLLGRDVIEATILAVNADRYSYGHRFHAARRLRLREASAYESTLEEKGMVIADFDKRKKKISQDINALALQKDARIRLDEALLDEVTGLVELPVALMGNIDAEFMGLPDEVLISSMQGHQKYFPLVDAAQSLLPHFIFISNIRSKAQQSVIQGNERVLRARLADARFFWEADRKAPLASKKALLENILFQQKLGSLADKATRVQRLAVLLAESLDSPVDSLQRAAELCKLDLVTDMVGEFPELQGIMGKYYALHDGESKQVGAAIEQHYWPKFAGDQIPDIDEGKFLAIADKLDTICGLFAIEQFPSGDRDPFALRRLALGICRILIEGELELDVRWAINETLAGYALTIDANVPALIYDFIFERLKTYYQTQGFDSRYYQAVRAVKPLSPLDFDRRLKAVDQFTRLPAAESLIEANKRISNMLQKNPLDTSEVNESMLVLQQEQALYKNLQTVSEMTATQLRQRRYGELLITLTELKQPVDDFFDQVMVMDENLDYRRNRLALLQQIQRLFHQVADVSSLQ